MREDPRAVDNGLILLGQFKKLCDNAVQDIVRLVSDPHIGNLSDQYRANIAKRHVDLGLNLFAIISNTYYRENFHSDILSLFLDPKGPHKGGKTYLDLFLYFIASHNVNINFENYTNVKITREEGRIDILIKDETSKRAIIIENKINGAGDMEKQIPRYLASMEAQGYTCDAIVYLRLNGIKHPDRLGWTSDEIKKVYKLLKVICAYDGTGEYKDLSNGWISRCEPIAKEAHNTDAAFILRQYRDILKKLGGNVMNKIIMDEFYTMMRQNNGANYKTAMSLKSMLDDLLTYRVDKLKEMFSAHPEPFKVFDVYNKNDVVFDQLQIENNVRLGIDIIVEPEHYRFIFWDKNCNQNHSSENPAKVVLDKMNCFGEFKEIGLDDRIQFELISVFEFPAKENELYEYIRNFNSKLSELAAHKSI